MLRRIGSLLGGAAAAALAAFGTAAPAAATSLTVSPMVAELHARPGTPDRVDITVVNSGKEPERVTVTPLEWSTRTDGTLEIEKLGTNPHSLTPYISTPVWQFVLHGGERRILPLDVAVPPQSAPTSLWGGVLVKGTSPDRAATTLGPATTVLVYADVGEPRRHLKIDALRIVPVGNGRCVVMARLRNDGDAYVRAGGHLIVSQAGRVVVDREVSIGAIFPHDIRLLQQHVDGLARGAVADVSLQVDYGADVLLDGETHIAVP